MKGGVGHTEFDYDVFCINAHITGSAGANNINVFKLRGSVLVLDQFAEITEVTDLSDCTDVHADVWDGTNSVALTKTTGTDLTSMPVGTFFSKLNDVTLGYTIHDASQCRMTEPSSKEVGKPFIVTQKNGADTYIRFNFTTSGTVDFKMHVYFKFRVLNGGSLTLA